MKYSEKKLLIGKQNIIFRYSGWDRCFNFLPYIVLRANPNNCSDFCVESGWLIWAAGFRFYKDKIYCRSCGAKYEHACTCYSDEEE